MKKLSLTDSTFVQEKTNYPSRFSSKSKSILKQQTQAKTKDIFERKKKDNGGPRSFISNNTPAHKNNMVCKANDKIKIVRKGTMP